MAEANTIRLGIAAGALLLTLACSASRPPVAAAPVVPSEPAPAATAIGAPEPLPVPPADEPLEEEPGAVELEPEEEPAELAGVEPVEPVADAETLLHESLDAYESATAFWEQGALEDAIAALDHAFERMAEVPSNGDPLLAQEKENLRQLISRRIVEIYASRQTTVGDPDLSIPLVVNPDVEREIASFQGRERAFFLEAYRRSGLYRPMIVEQLREAGLPEQLSWLPLVESGFKERALSRARALGLWQFIASTGYRYGLDRSDWVDERMDPEKATQAAIAYLNALHNLFGDWMTALAAYNCGEHSVLKQIQRQQVSYFDQFWDLYARLPSETRRYVPRFLAVLAILDDPAQYGFELPETYAPVEFETVEIARAAKLESLDGALGLERGTLAKMNPELRRNATPNRAYPLKVPIGAAQTVLASVDSLPKWEPPQVTTAVHRVRRGDTLSGIAARYGTSVSELMSLNNLRSAHRISPGQQLRVPGRGSAPAIDRTPIAPGQSIAHNVRPGDSLWLLASRYGTTVEQIKADNRLTGNMLQPGQVLTLRSAAGAAAASAPTPRKGAYVVRSGDTLGSIAERNGVALDRLLAANHLSDRSTIYPGQQLQIPE